MNPVTLTDYDAIVVGAGLYGLTMAERIAGQLGKRVLVIDRRSGIGGNAASDIDPDSGIEVHSYGSHLFHTSNPKIIDYVHRFTSFNTYRHQVVAVHDGRRYSMPINLHTITEFFGRDMTPDQARALLAEQAREGDPTASDLENWAIGHVGRPLYEAFIRGYTAKQWQTDPRLLSSSIIARLPIRYTDNRDYFDDTVQGLPIDGYAAWFARMVDHPLIDVRLGVDFADVRADIPPGLLVVYTGPLDEYFGWCFGTLGWRTLDFETTRHKVRDVQGAAVVNYCDDDVAFTRVHEFKHLHPERSAINEPISITAREYSRWAESGDEPYYPVRRDDDLRALAAYREVAAAERSTIFGGRLGSYRYLDMHMAIGAALTTFERHVVPWFEANGFGSEVFASEVSESKGFVGGIDD